MKKTQYFLLIAVNALFLFVAGCKPAAPEPTAEERMKKSWTAQTVTENSTTVYTNGGTSNSKPGYSQFSLNLSGLPNVTLKTLDGQTFTGTATISSDGRTLTLSNLTPAPTGGNTIIFTIGNLTDSGVTLTRTTPDPKVGNATVVYTLKTP
jgi:hypothetical protein